MKLKLFILYSLLAHCFISSNAVEQNTLLRRVSEEQISLYTVKIHEELSANALHRKLVTYTTVAGLCGGAYYFMYGGKTIPPAIAPSVQDNMPASPLETLPPEVIAMLKAQAKEYFNQSWLAWLKTNFYTIFQQTTVLFMFTAMNNALGPISKYLNALDGLVDRSISTVFHDGNLAWFLKKHTQLASLFMTLEYHAAIVEGKPLAPQTAEFLPITVALPMPELTTEEFSAEKKQYHVEQTVHTWNIMVQQLEYVLGFMQATSSEQHWYELAVLQAQALMRTVIEEFNTCAQTLENILHNKDNASMYDTIRLLHVTTEQDFNGFANLERLKPY